MKQIKLSGRERTVLRHIDFATGTSGEELIERTRLEPGDLIDVINALIEVGYAEMTPYEERAEVATFREKMFDVNPSYVLELRAAMSRR